tara:strand:+ start:1027 stop:1833 length:807 start_codon:yes stop_codon:yes gene_type:complete
MVVCSFCNDPMMMPFVCSLCMKKNCSKHRLPEQHNCENINEYSNTNYAKIKIRKNNEMQQLSSGYSENANISVKSKYSKLLNLSETNNNLKVIILCGALLGFMEVSNSFLRGSESFISTIGVILTTSIFFTLIYLKREIDAEKLFAFNSFIYWPLGILISIVSSMIGFPLILFGFFNSIGGERVVDVIKNIYQIIIIIIVPLILILNLFNHLFTNIVLMSINSIIWYMLLMLFPIGNLDGAKLLNYDRGYYIKLVLTMISIYLISIIL